MLLELLFVYIMRLPLWNMTSALCNSSSVLSSPALLLIWLIGEWWTGANIHVPKQCCQAVAAAASSISAPAKKSHWSICLCQLKLMEKEYALLWKGWVIWNRQLARATVSNTEGRERTALGRSFRLALVINFWLEMGCFYLFSCLKISW